MGRKCLKCGYERQESDVAPDYECPQCGAVYWKVEARQAALQSQTAKHGEGPEPKKLDSPAPPAEAKAQRSEKGLRAEVSPIQFFAALSIVFFMIWAEISEPGRIDKWSERFFGFITLGGLLILGILIYFVPTFVAGHRRHPQTLAIFVLNLFVGWTFLGWVASLVWAATAFKQQSQPDS